MNFSQWLASLGLDHYEAGSARHDIDIEVAPLLTEAEAARRLRAELQAVAGSAGPSAAR